MKRGMIMYCDNCGNQLRDNAKFCNKCGTPVAEMLENAESASVATVETKETVSDEIAIQSQAAEIASAADTENDPYAFARKSTPKASSPGQVSQPSYQQPRYYAPGTHPYHRLGGLLWWFVAVNYVVGVLGLIGAGLFVYQYIVSFRVFSYSHLIAYWLFSLIGSVAILLTCSGILFSFAGKIRRKDDTFLHTIQSGSLTMMIVFATFRGIELAWISIASGLPITFSQQDIIQIVIFFSEWLFGLIINSIYFGSSVRVRTYMGSDSYLRKSVLNKGTVSPIPADGSDRFEEIRRKQNRPFDPESEWICYECGRINANYVTTCHCGNPKPIEDMSKRWVCKSCGAVNAGKMHNCVSCGNGRQTEAPWVCSACGASNPGSASSCTVCFAQKSQKPDKKPIGQSDWQCPQCKTVNPGYVTTCTCGCPSSLGAKLDTYSGGEEPEPERLPSADEWKCLNCGRINSNYVGTCACGTQKQI